MSNNDGSRRSLYRELAITFVPLSITLVLLHVVWTVEVELLIALLAAAALGDASRRWSQRRKESA